MYTKGEVLLSAKNLSVKYDKIIFEKVILHL